MKHVEIILTSTKPPAQQTAYRLIGQPTRRKDILVCCENETKQTSKLMCHIALDKNNRKIYQREKTPTAEYEQQWAPNTIQTIIMIGNAKGIPNAIAQNCKTKLENSSS